MLIIRFKVIALKRWKLDTSVERETQTLLLKMFRVLAALNFVKSSGRFYIFNDSGHPIDSSGSINSMLLFVHDNYLFVIARFEMPVT